MPGPWASKSSCSTTSGSWPPRSGRRVGCGGSATPRGRATPPRNATAGSADRTPRALHPETRPCSAGSGLSGLGEPTKARTAPTSSCWPRQTDLGRRSSRSSSASATTRTTTASSRRRLRSPAPRTKRPSRGRWARRWAFWSAPWVWRGTLLRRWWRWPATPSRTWPIGSRRINGSWGNSAESRPSSRCCAVRRTTTSQMRRAPRSPICSRSTRPTQRDSSPRAGSQSYCGASWRRKM
mmetsp:Transcript_8127/g.26656  ORF Transcript_8127/g.26656 Transcript_8127/m.26656 type:complete len:238 (+) Transcript_8127:482-1195(+)